MGLALRKVVDLDVFDWMPEGNCWNVAHRYPYDKNPFFMEGRGYNYGEARSYCATCPVVIDCLLAALDDDHEGFQGGMSKNERNEVRKMLIAGTSFIRSVESIWKRHRKKRRVVPVPDVKVWKEWNV